MKLRKGILVFAAQALSSLALCWVLTGLIWLEGPWYAIAAWGAMPAAGLFSACLTTRHGVNNYIAWLAPPLAAFFAHVIVTGYAPVAGPVLLTALLSIAGAAAGYVKNQTKK